MKIAKNIGQYTLKRFNRAEELFLTLFYVMFTENKTKEEAITSRTLEEIFRLPVDEDVMDKLIFENYEGVKTHWEKKVLRKFYDYCITKDMARNGFERMYSIFLQDNPHLIPAKIPSNASSYQSRTS